MKTRILNTGKTEKSLMIPLAVSIQYASVTDRQTDRQTDGSDVGYFVTVESVLTFAIYYKVQKK